MKTDKMGPLLSFRGRTPAVPHAATTAALAATLLLTMGAALTPATTVWAQAAGDSAPAATASASYKIGVDDQIDVSVVDHPEAAKLYAVPSDGIIEPQVGGDVNVLGMTVSQLRTRLTKAFAKKYYQPQVIVNVHPALQTVNVVGVTHAGKLSLKQGDRLFAVLANAGGLPIDRPELYKGTLFRSTTGQAIPIDIPKLYANDPEQNVEVYSGDTIYIEEKAATATTIQVIGEVGKPGPILAPRDESILTVLQNAGGPTPLAALSRVTVDHNGVQTVVDMRNYKVTGFDPAVKIEGGDKLIVPENKNQYYVTGAGERTGTQVYPDDKPLSVYTTWTLAGGSTEGVDLHNVTLFHPVADGRTQKTIVDIEQMNKTGNFSGDKPVVPGDSVYFPPSKSRKGLSAGEAIGLFTGIVGVFYTLTQLRH